MFRTTFAAASRAVREWRALEWFHASGFRAPRALLVAEHRRFGFLRRAVLVTKAWAGETAEQVLGRLEAGPATTLIAAIRTQVAAWHERGFRDGNLDLRNLLVRRTGDAWTIVKIDSPRWRRRAPGATTDRAAAADWRRLAADLERMGHALDPTR